jgi:hypothetical protein
VKVGSLIRTPTGPARLVRYFHAAVVEDQAGLRRVWHAEECRTIPEPKPDEGQEVPRVRALGNGEAPRHGGIS